MNSLYQQLVVFARLMGIVVLESCVNPRNLTAITIDHTGTILAERHSTPTWEGHPPRHGGRSAPTTGLQSTTA